MKTLAEQFVDRMPRYEAGNETNRPAMVELFQEALAININLNRKLYEACLYAFQWHCGNGNLEAQVECMRILTEALGAYEESNQN